MPNAINYTPFGTPIRKADAVDLDKKELAQFGLELDKETGSMIIVQKDPIDLDEVIQSYKDQCGMELAQNLIKRGLADPDDFAAKPGDYGDISALPDNLNDAYQASLAAKGVEKANGLDLGDIRTQADLQKYVNQLIAEKLKAAEVGAPVSQNSEVKDNA